MLIEIARKKCPYTRGIEQNYGVLGEGFRVIFDPAGRSGEIVCQHRCFYTNGDMVCEFPWSHPSLDGFVEAPRWTSLVLPETDENDDLRSLQLPGKIVQLESRGQSATPMFLTKVLQKLRNNGDDLSKLNELVCPELPHALSPLIDFFQSMQLGRLTVLRLDTESRIFDYRRIVAGSLPADDFPAFVTSIAESLPLLQELSIGLLYTPTCTSTFLRSGMHLLRPRYAKLTIRIQYEIECVEGPWLAVALLAYLQDPEKTDGLSLRLSGRCHSVGVCVIQGVKRFAPEMVL